MAWKTSWSISIDGRDASSGFNPFLIAITVHEKEGKGGDTASLELDDTAGINILPRAGAHVVIALAGVQKFDGYTEDPQCDYSRGGGRKISVHCVSHDSRGPAKDAQRWHQDGGTLADFLSRAATEAGMTITVAAAFASIARDWWSPDGASFLHLGTRMADELGAVFKVKANKAVFAERGSGTSAGGAALATVTFDFSDGTMHSGNSTPLKGKSSRTRALSTWFDRKSAKWQIEEVAIDPLAGGPDSHARPRYNRADKDTSRRAAMGRKDDAAHHRGGATVASDLRVAVPVGAPAIIVNWRPGVDGAWVIKGAEHHLTRSGGGISHFELARPSGAAGTDGRAKSSAAAAASSSGAAPTASAGTVPSIGSIG